MKYPKGQSGNKNGRPKGAKNKVTLTLRESITGFIDNNFEKIAQDLMKLGAKDRVKLYLELMQYSLPELQATSVDLNLDKMTTEEVNRHFDGLIAAARRQ